MKATIRERITGARLRNTVPPAYRDEASKNTNLDGIYAVILLAHNERDVNPSPPLTKAFRRLRHVPRMESSSPAPCLPKRH